MEGRYLLSIKDIKETIEREKEDFLWERICERLDGDRRTRVNLVRMPEKKAACAGAGILLQWAVQNQELQGQRTSGRGLQLLSLSDILTGLGNPISLQYSYGPRGKPYLREQPFFFNLSHSGEYVVCALSDCEIGVDIQYQRAQDSSRLAERFFHIREKELLEQAGTKEEYRDLFYKLWTMKEAYGKMTGEGITAVIGMDFSGINNVRMREFTWEEYEDLKDYKIACCRRIPGKSGIWE